MGVNYCRKHEDCWAFAVMMLLVEKTFSLSASEGRRRWGSEQRPCPHRDFHRVFEIAGVLLEVQLE